jgi:hypothetical protein
MANEQLVSLDDTNAVADAFPPAPMPALPVSGMVDQVDNGVASIQSPDLSMSTAPAGPGMVEGAAVPQTPPAPLGAEQPSTQPLAPGEQTATPVIKVPDTAINAKVPSQPERVAAAEADRAALQDQQAEQVATQADAEAKAAQSKADALARQQAEQRTLESQQRDAMLEAHEQFKAAHEETKNFQFHDRWADKDTGQKLLGGFAMILGGVGGGYLGHENQVVKQMQAATAQDFKKQEAELARRQEDERGASKNEDEVAKRHNDEWNRLKFRQAQQLEAVAAQGEVMVTKAKGAQNVLAARQVADQYRAAGVALEQNTQENIAKRHLTVAQTREAYAKANEANAAAAFHRAGRADATEAKAAAATDKGVNDFLKSIEKEGQGTGTQAGPIRKQEHIENTQSALKAAIASGDPQTIRAAVDAATEAAGPILSGGKTTRFSAELIKANETYKDRLAKLSGNLTGKAVATKDYAQQVGRLFDQAGAANEPEVAALDRKAQQRLFGPGGLARTPSAKENAMNGHGAIFSAFKGKYGQTGAPAAQAAGPPAGWTEVTLQNGEVGYASPDKKQFVAK